MDVFALVRFVIGSGALAFAAVSDVRSRRVDDPLWVLLGTAGLALLVVELAIPSARPDLLALAGASGILFYAVFYGEPLFEEDGFHARPLRIATFLAAGVLAVVSARWAAQGTADQVGEYLRFLPVPALVLGYQGLYQVGLLHGGADTKALIALTLLFPTAPETSPFPLLATPVAFPFSFVTLINAAILFLVIPLVYLAVNAARGDLAFPMALFGTRHPLDRLPEHAWLMEKIDKRGEHVLVLFPRRGGHRNAEVEKLRAAGVTEAWVQPQVPFLVPLLAGFLLAFFVGNLLMGFLTAVLPRP